jgi:arylsulfatase
MDQEIGRVLAQLRSMNAMQNTLMVFLSDNGASAEIMVRDDGHDRQAAPGSAASHLCLGPGWSTVANTPFRRHKTWVHEGGTATPCIMHWPQGFNAKGTLRHDPAHVIDIVPTFLDVASLADAPVESDGPPRPGMSLLPALLGKQSLHPPYHWWLHEGNRALRMGDWKIVAAQNQPWELYDLAHDRTETRDLAASDPTRVREMEAFWDARNKAFSQHYRDARSTTNSN